MSDPEVFWEVFRELAPWGIVLFVVILDGGIISRLRRRNHEMRLELRRRDTDEESRSAGSETGTSSAETA